MDIIVLGSLLRVSVNRGTSSFPVGKVQFMTMYPLEFEEYLMSKSEKELIEMIKDCYRNDIPLEKPFHERVLDYYKEYLFVGGMPEAVEEFEKIIIQNLFVLFSSPFWILIWMIWENTIDKVKFLKQDLSIKISVLNSQKKILNFVMSMLNKGEEHRNLKTQLNGCL